MFKGCNINQKHVFVICVNLREATVFLFRTKKRSHTEKVLKVLIVFSKKKNTFRVSLSLFYVYCCFIVLNTKLYSRLKKSLKTQRNSLKLKSFLVQ